MKKGGGLGGKAGSQSGDDSTDSILQAISAFRDIESMLHGEEETVSLPLRDLIPLLPEDYVTTTNVDDLPNTKVSVTVEDLFFQLTKGRVVISAAKLASCLPSELVRPQALEDENTMIRLPLNTIVRSVDPKLLKERIASRASRHKVDNIPDPFARVTPVVPRPPAPPAEPVAEPAAEEPVTEEAAPVAPPPESEEAAPVGVPSAPPSEPALEPVATEMEEAPAEPTPTEEEAPVAISEPVIEPVAEAPAEVAEEAPAESVKLEAAEPAPVPEKPATVPRPRRKPAPQPPAPETEYEEVDGLGGVNLNNATLEQILTLDGVSSAMAEAILKYRAEHGQFKNVFELQRIPRMGRKTFRKMTGMAYSKSRHHRRWKLAKLLSLSAAEAEHLPAVVKGLASMPAFIGCVICDRDGLLLAQQGASTDAEAISALAPRFLQLMTENLSALNLGEPETVSISIGERMLTMAACGRVCLTAIHSRRKLTKAQLTLVTKVAAELAWLVSHRAFVGKQT